MLLRLILLLSFLLCNSFLFLSSGLSDTGLTQCSSAKSRGTNPNIPKPTISQVSENAVLSFFLFFCLHLKHTHLSFFLFCSLYFVCVGSLHLSPPPPFPTLVLPWLFSILLSSPFLESSLAKWSFTFVILFWWPTLSLPLLCTRYFVWQIGQLPFRWPYTHTHFVHIRHQQHIRHFNSLAFLLLLLISLCSSN